MQSKCFFLRTKFGHSWFRYPFIANMTKYSKVSICVICNWFYPVITYWLDSLPKIGTWKLDSSWSAALGVSGNYLVGKERPRLVWLGKGQGASRWSTRGLIPNIFLHFLLLNLETIRLISPKFSTLFDLSVSLFRGGYPVWENCWDHPWLTAEPLQPFRSCSSAPCQSHPMKSPAAWRK